MGRNIPFKSLEQVKFVGNILKVEDRLDAMEKEIAELKTQLFPRKTPRVVRLRGVLRGLRVSPLDVDEAKKSLFKHASS